MPPPLQPKARGPIKAPSQENLNLVQDGAADSRNPEELASFVRPPSATPEGQGVGTEPKEEAQTTVVSAAAVEPNEGLRNPLLQHIANRLKGLRLIDAIYPNEVDDLTPAAIIDAIRPSYSFTYTETRSRTRSTGALDYLGYARSGLSGFVTVDRDSASALKTSEQLYCIPCFQVFPRRHTQRYPRSLTPTALNARDISGENFSKALLTAFSNSYPTITAKTSILGPMLARFTRYLYEPSTSSVGFLVKTLLLACHIFGTGSGNCSISHSTYLRGIPDQFKVSRSINVCREVRLHFYNPDTYLKELSKGSPSGVALPSDTVSEMGPSSATVFINPNWLDRSWFHIFVMVIARGPIVMLQHPSTDQICCRIADSGDVLNYSFQGGPVPDLLALYNAFRYEGYSDIHLVLLTPADKRKWTFSDGNERDLDYDGTPHLATDFFPLFANGAIWDLRAVLGWFQELWNVLISQFVTPEEITTAITFAATAAVVYRPQSVIATAEPKVNGLSWGRPASSYFSLTSEGHYWACTWDQRSASQKDSVVFCASCSLPWGQTTTSRVGWTASGDTFLDAQRTNVAIPSVDTDFISLRSMEVFSTTNTSLLHPKRWSFFSSLRAAVDLAHNYAAVNDFFAYICGVSFFACTPFRHARNYNVGEMLHPWWKLKVSFAERFLDDQFGWYMQPENAMMKDRDNVDEIAFTAVPSVTVQRMPLPMLNHFIGMNLTRENLFSSALEAIEPSKYLTLYNSDNDPIFDKLSISAPTVTEFKETPHLLANWYRLSTGLIAYSNKETSNIKFTALWYPDYQYPLTGFTYTYLPPSMVMTYLTSMPTFIVGEPVSKSISWEDKEYIMNLSLPPLLHPYPTSFTRTAVISLDIDWDPASGPIWLSGAIRNTISSAGRRLLMEHKISSRARNAASLFLAD